MSRSETPSSFFVEEGLHAYEDERSSEAGERISAQQQEGFEAQETDPAEVERVMDRVLSVYKRLRKTGRQDDRRSGCHVFSYAFQVPTDEYEEAEEKENVLRALGDIPPDLQSAVFDALMESNHVDEALELILLRKITRVSPRGSDMLLWATATGSEDKTWKEALEYTARMRSEYGPDYKFRLTEQDFPFFIYFKSLEQVALTADVREYVKRYGLLESLPDHLEEFPEVSRAKLVAEYSRLQRMDVLAKYLEKFPGVSHQRLLERLISSTDSDDLTAVLTNIRKFRISESERVECLKRIFFRIPLEAPNIRLSLREQEQLFDRFISDGYEHWSTGLPQAVKWQLAPEWMVQRMRQVNLGTEKVDTFLRHQNWGAFQPIFSKDTADFLFDQGYGNTVIRTLLYFEDVDEARVLAQLAANHASGKRPRSVGRRGPQSNDNPSSNSAEPRPLDQEKYIFEFLRQRYSFEDTVQKLKSAIEPKGRAGIPSTEEANGLAADTHSVDWVLKQWVRDFPSGVVTAENESINGEALRDLARLLGHPWQDAKARELVLERLMASVIQLPLDLLDEYFTKEEQKKMAIVGLRSGRYEFWDQRVLPSMTPEECRMMVREWVKDHEPLRPFCAGRDVGSRRFREKCGIDFARELALEGCLDMIAYMVLFQDVLGTSYTRADVVCALSFKSASTVGTDGLDWTHITQSLTQLPLDRETSFSDPRMESVWRDWNDAAIPAREKQELLALDYRQSDEVRHARRRVQLSPLEARSILGSNDEWRDNEGQIWPYKAALELDKKGRPQNKDLVFEALLAEAKWPALGMDDSIVRCMRRGQELFGASIMLAYMNRPCVPRHDAVHFMDQIEALYQKTGLSPKQFAQNILLQVARDTATYEGGTSYSAFAAACHALVHVSFNPNDEASVLNKLESWRESLPELGATIDILRRDGPFASWMHLKAAHEAYTISQREELLQQLKNEPNSRLRSFVSTLAFTPGIAMDDVFKLWQEPHEFFSIPDQHAPDGLQDAKKPSNYLTVAYLDWSASDLRDAVVGREGEKRSTLDRLQTIPVMDCTYTIMGRPENDTREPENLHRMLLEALGSRKRGVRGMAQDPGKVFSLLGGVLQKLNLEAKVHATSLIESPLVLAYLREYRGDLYKEIEELVFDVRIGMPRPPIDEQTFRIRIGEKSDPGMIVTESDAGGCMPFGSGKGNVYWCNPNCAQLVVQRQTGQDKWKTIAQSVVTINQQTAQLVPDLVQAFRNDPKTLTSHMKAEDFSLPRFIACDNIEVEKNQAESYGKMLAKVYGAFWRDYLTKHAKTLRVSPEKVLVGKGYSPADMGLKSEPNKTIPLVPMSYSDNLHEESFVVETGLEPTTPEARPYVRPIEVTDVYAIAHLESKAFADTSMGYGIHQVQNNLVGIGIANEYFNRPNLSFIVQEEGKPAAAYIVAYEGRVRDEKFVYVDDMAASERGNPAGGRALLAFVEAYKSGYQSDRILPPILASMRDQTSFQLVLNQLDRLSQRNNWVTEMIERGSAQRGDDVMHQVTILIARSPEELEEQKRRFEWFDV